MTTKPLPKGEDSAKGGLILYKAATMKQTKALVFSLLFILGALSTPAAAIESYTVYTVDDIQAIYNVYAGAGGDVSFLVNGRLFETKTDLTSGLISYLYDGNLVTTIHYLEPNLEAILIKQLSQMLPTSTGSLQNQNSASTVVSQQVFQELVVPTVKTRSEKKSPAGHLRAIGGSIRYENVEDNKDDGDLYGVNLGLAYDLDNWTFGGMLPYDRFDFNSHQGERIGAILFGQYHWDWSDTLSSAVTANINYFETDLEFSHGGGDLTIKTTGGGLGLGVNYHQEAYEVGLGSSLLYNKENIDWYDDEQYLLKLGVNAGYRILDNQVLNAFCTYTNDVTDYKYDYGDNDLYEVGAEYKGDFSENWSLSVGYKKTLDLEGYDNDTFYLGSIWKF